MNLGHDLYEAAVLEVLGFFVPTSAHHPFPSPDIEHQVGPTLR
jgi:hypothetical protein